MIEHTQRGDTQLWTDHGPDDADASFAGPSHQTQRRGSPRKIGAKIIHHQTPGAGGPPVTKEGGPIHPAGSMSLMPPKAV